MRLSSCTYEGHPGLPVVLGHLEQDAATQREDPTHLSASLIRTDTTDGSIKSELAGGSFSGFLISSRKLIKPSHNRVKKS